MCVALVVNRHEFERRIRVYLDLDVPKVGARDVIAAALASRLFPYLSQPIPPYEGDSPSLRSLLDGERVLLYFSAAWDHSAPGYRALVGDVGAMLGVRVVDVDVDDPVGTGLAHALKVLNTPSVVDSDRPEQAVIGARARHDLVGLFTDGPR